MSIFEYTSYKQFVTEKIRSMPKKGRGQYLKIANYLQVHTTMVSHVFKGDANIGVEQGLKLCQYFGLSDLETDFFMNLLHRERAGDVQSQAYYDKKLEELKLKATDIKQRLGPQNELDDQQKATFYSHWYYSGIRLLTALDGFDQPEAIANHLNLPLSRVREVIDFLLQTGLCREEKGHLKVGTTSTYIDVSSPLVSRHHFNWRHKVAPKIDAVSNEELVFTNPITISKQDFLRVREELIQMIEKFKAIADPSEPELLGCLNIDWVKI